MMPISDERKTRTSEEHADANLANARCADAHRLFGRPPTMEA
jgi:hypothetical protein